jgi:hypothetical protein
VRDDEARPGPSPVTPVHGSHHRAGAVGCPISGVECVNSAGTPPASFTALQRRNPMIDLYFWPTGKKVVILLEECGLPYTIKPINIGRGDQLPPIF